MIPKRRKREKMMAPKEDAAIRCPGQGQWVRGHECAAAGRRVISPLGRDLGIHKCMGRMEAHHAKTRGAGGGDDKQVPLCSLAHKQHHDGCTFGIDFEKLAAELWRVSPHGKKYRLEHSEPDTGPINRPPQPCPSPSDYPNSARSSGRANSGEG